MYRRHFLQLNAREDRSPKNRLALAPRLTCALLWLMLVGGGHIVVAQSAVAQHTTVEKNGLAGTIETDHNAAGKATEMRTIGVDGKLQQKVVYDYLPGYYVPGQTDTTYWPSGQMRKVVRKTYDESANFTGEFIQIYDQAGKQIAGHKLTHDPWKGTYRCSEWNASAQNYQNIECPSGEEEGGSPTAPKKFTYDEVMKHLDAARKNADPSPTIAPPISSSKREVGIILPAQLYPGERVSGTVVENPDRYADMPYVTVTRVAVPFESAGEGSRLSGWMLEAPGEEPRRADGPITLVVPRSGSTLNIAVWQAGNPADSFSQTLNFSPPSTKNVSRPNSFRVAALCMKGGLCAVSGPFGGDSSKTFAAFEDRPATIVAESPGGAYLSIPELTVPGSRPLFIAEGSRVVALPAVVGDFFVRNNGRELQAGETLIAFPTLDGPGDVPDAAWQSGNFPASNLERARQLIPGFTVTGGECESRETGEAEEKREAEEKEEEGKILLVIKNLAPEQTTLHSSTNEMVVFCLSDEAFQRGAFKYDLRIDARKSGKVDVKGYVIPFLGPVSGQEFSAQAELK